MGIMKKNAFTLAETLVTLAIIGMIASMLIPPLINSYQKTVNQVKLRKVYAILAQISQRAVAEYGDMSYIDFYDGSSEKVQEWYLTYFKPNLKIAKECFDDSGCWSEDVTHLNGDAVSNATARGIGGNIVTFKTIDGTLYNIDGNVPADLDTQFGIDSDIDGLVVYVDLNGEKKPNIIGKDIFVFVYTDKGFVPAGNDRTKEFVAQNCSEDGSGVMCASNIARNNWKFDDVNM